MSDHGGNRIYDVWHAQCSRSGACPLSGVDIKFAVTPQTTSNEMSIHNCCLTVYVNCYHTVYTKLRQIIYTTVYALNLFKIEIKMLEAGKNFAINLKGSTTNFFLVSNSIRHWFYLKQCCYSSFTDLKICC